jgi:hypothetical protein
MIILSFDCAYKSLAYVLLELVPNEDFIKCNTLLEYDVTDVLDNKKIKSVNPTERTKLLCLYLQGMYTKISKYKIDFILIENQASRYKYNFCVQSQIDMFLAVMLPNVDIMYVNPVWKNKLTFGGYTIKNFRANCTKKEDANKKHTQAMFCFLMKQCDFKITLKHAKWIRDISDALLQIYGYILYA